MLRSISPPTASPPRRRSPQAAASAPRNEQRSTLVSPSLASAGSLATDALDRSLGFLRIPLASSANLHLLGADPDHFTEYTLLLNNSRAPLLHPDNLLAWMSCRRMSCAIYIFHETLGQGARQISHRRHEVRTVSSLIFYRDCSPRCRRCSSILLCRCKCHAATRSISLAWCSKHSNHTRAAPSRLIPWPWRSWPRSSLSPASQ